VITRTEQNTLSREDKSCAGLYNYKFQNKEWQDELSLNLYDFEARNYDPAIVRTLTQDPHAEKYYNWSPYSFIYNNPLLFVDPDGKDPIYGKNFWGRVKLIGDDGQNNGASYLVRGDVKKDVKAATKEGQNYSGALTEGKNVMNIPTGGVMDDVIDSVADTEVSKKENGGHANKGDANATRWDEGPAAQEVKDANGNVIGAKATVNPFNINGTQSIPTNASNVEFWWHTHPKADVGGVQLGSSNPSEADKSFQGTMQNRGFTGNTFVIGVRSGTVTFYDKNGALMTVSYSDFKKMGGK
jgi:RHS repeat-associated protein